MILERELINRKRSLQEFFDESELWSEVYNSYWEIAPLRNRKKALTMMHDIRYICVCMYHDKELDRYLSADAFDSYIKRAMAYVIFKVIKDLPQKISDLLPVMYVHLSKWDKFHLIEKKLDELLAKEKQYSVDMTIQPEPPKNIKFDYSKWNKLTCGFERDAIIEVLALWKSQNERLEILQKMEEMFKSQYRRLNFYYLEEQDETIRNCFIELRGQLEGDNFFVEEIKRLNEENKQLKEKVKSLEGSKMCNFELVRTRQYGVMEGMKTIVEQLIAYADSFTPDQNYKAEIIQGGIMSLIFNKYIPEEVLDNEHRVKLNKLGKKEKGLSLNAESMFKIIGNDQVNIGGNNGK